MGREYPAQPVVGVGAVVLRRGANALEVLLARRANPPSQHEWSLPGGVVELGERLESAVVREVLEETGLTVVVLDVVEVLEHISRDEAGRVRFHYVLTDYVCRVRGGLLAPATDAEDVCWRPVHGLEEAGNSALRAATIRVIQKAAAVFQNLQKPA